MCPVSWGFGPEAQGLLGGDRLLGGPSAVPFPTLAAVVPTLAHLLGESLDRCWAPGTNYHCSVTLVALEEVFKNSGLCGGWQEADSRMMSLGKVAEMPLDLVSQCQQVLSFLI